MQGSILKTVDDDSLGVCKGYNCDCHNYAKYLVQGETDGFGFEELYFCQDCYDKMHSDEIRNRLGLEE